ncbi:hypothetical protein WOLCODRAFT_155117 [Wolfiporia cocos MD-104 SS10]|uniref:Uncharacterized protein n=1 Tax=Wolfiporia cocos (strain MD-104) TaxID=742152 RepID=A0A2H3K1P8_WOLCO|nr:hypothetical protein WOLCODRAFT_155117 [Wolfiporia cocos MD-104 SS10]
MSGHGPTRGSRGYGGGVGVAATAAPNAWPASKTNARRRLVANVRMADDLGKEQWRRQQFAMMPISSSAFNDIWSTALLIATTDMTYHCGSAGLLTVDYESENF